jgi:cytochrome c oxidase cbb3-type subunit 1
MTAHAERPKTGLDANAMIVGGILLLGALWSLFAAANGADANMRLHAWVIGAGFVLGLFGMVGVYSNGGVERDPAEYNENIVKYGVIASMFWAIAGLLVGVIIASQLAWPAALSFDALPQLNFGRLRPVHTSAVIFAFGGNVLIATSFYVVQRTTRARLAGGVWPWFVFWGYQLFIVVAATGYLLGITQSRNTPSRNGTPICG